MDKKIILLLSAFFILLTAIAAFAIGGQKDNKATIQKTEGASINILEYSKTVGDIHYNGGDLIESFPIKNTGTKDLEIANIATSCMCTKAYLKTGDTKSEEFGMKGMTTPSNWKGIIKPGQTAEIVADFDPKYHGPSGIGPIQRTVSFETNDIDHPYIEVGFSGTVIK